MRTLKLSADDFSIELGTRLSPFVRYEPTIVDSGTVEYSLYGSAIEDGNLYEPKWIWAITVYLGREAWQTLQLIYQRSERKRRTQTTYGAICEDFITPYIEDTLTPTRLLATGGSVSPIGSQSIAYPAQFAVRMFEPKAIEGNNALYPYLVSFVLKELDRVTP